MIRMPTMGEMAASGLGASPSRSACGMAALQCLIEGPSSSTAWASTLAPRLNEEAQTISLSPWHQRLRLEFQLSRQKGGIREHKQGSRQFDLYARTSSSATANARLKCPAGPVKLSPLLRRSSDTQKILWSKGNDLLTEL